LTLVEQLKRDTLHGLAHIELMDISRVSEQCLGAVQDHPEDCLPDENDVRVVVSESENCH
jgi:hypothetical protein